jgi:hypothetical protein
MPIFLQGFKSKPQIFFNYTQPFPPINPQAPHPISYRLFSTSDPEHPPGPPLETQISKIRNFCIIAHIDHGKSTLADRLIEECGNVSLNKDQVLDKLAVERERGITVKAQSCTMVIASKNGNNEIFT